MIAAKVPESVRHAAGTVPGVRFDGPDEQVEFLVAEWGERPDFTALPALKLVQVMSAGTDWIDGLLPPGVTLCNARSSRDIPVAEWVVGAILGAATGLLHSARTATWEHRPPAEVHASHIVIVGHGSIGRACATRLEALGAHVNGIGRADDLRASITHADVVVNLVPLTPESRGLFSADAFAAMRDGALFVNAGRGGTVDQQALLHELSAPRLRAVLDVTDPEPLPHDHPLWTAPGLLAITSHHAGDSHEADRRAITLAAEQLRAYAAGEPLRNVVQRSTVLDPHDGDRP